MITFDILRLIPRFIAEDRGGYAAAMAIRAGVQAVNDIIGNACTAFSDPEAMPEWRLDEMAWEYNLPYDYTADVDVKRSWIANAYSLSRLFGTAAGVEAYLKANFEDAELEEAQEYSGSPFHFRVNLSGPWTAERVAWALNAVNAVKNVRSVLDGMTVETPTIEGNIQVYAGAALYGAVDVDFPATEQPDIDNNYLTDELEDFLTDEVGLLGE